MGNDVVEQMKTDGSAAPVPLGDLLADALRGWNQNSPYTKSDDWVFPSLKLKGKTPLSASIMAADKIRPAALKVGIRLEPGQRFGFHNFRHSLATFLVSRGKDVKTIQGLLRHAKVTSTRLTCIPNPLTPQSSKRKKTSPWRSQVLPQRISLLYR